MPDFASRMIEAQVQRAAYDEGLERKQMAVEAAQAARRHQQIMEDSDALKRLNELEDDVQYRLSLTPEAERQHLGIANALATRLGVPQRTVLHPTVRIAIINDLKGRKAQAKIIGPGMDEMARGRYYQQTANEMGNLYGPHWEQFLGDYSQAAEMAAVAKAAPVQDSGATKLPAVGAPAAPALPGGPEASPAAEGAAAIPPPRPDGVGNQVDMVRTWLEQDLGQAETLTPEQEATMWRSLRDDIYAGRAAPEDVDYFAKLTSKLRGTAWTPESHKAIVAHTLAAAGQYQADKQGTDAAQLVADADQMVSDPAVAATQGNTPRGTFWEQQVLKLRDARGVPLTSVQMQAIHQDALRLNTEERTEEKDAAAAAKEQDRLRHQSLMENINLKQLNISLAHLGIAERASARAAAGGKAAKTTVEEYVDAFSGARESYRGPAGMVSFMAKKGESQAKVAQTLRAMKGLPPDAWMTFTLDDMKRRPDLYRKMGYGLTEDDALRKWDGDLDLALEFLYRRGRPKAKTAKPDAGAEFAAAITAAAARTKAK